MVRFSFPIEKMERDEDGDLVVKGVATDGTVDSDSQIVDADWSAKALAEWLDTGGNVRMSHDPQRPVGKGLQVDIDRDGDGKHWVKSVIVDPVAARLVEKGVLRAYSVGIAAPVIKRDPTGKARNGIIMGGQLVELSIVDRPSNKSSYLELAKSAAGDGAQFTGKLCGISDQAPAFTTVELPNDVSVSFSPADLAKLVAFKQGLEADVVKRQMDPDVGGGVDRDKIPAADFAGADRSFPIVTPKDVHDAALSLGRAKGQDTGKIKDRIISIAHRKGDAFVAQLPDAWKEDMGKGENVVDVVKNDTPDDQNDQAKPDAGEDENEGAAQEGDAAPMKSDKAHAPVTAGAKLTELFGVDISGIDPAVAKALTEAVLAQGGTEFQIDIEKGKGKKPFPGAAPPIDGKDSDGDGKDTDKPGSEEDDDGSEAKVKPGSAKKADAPEAAEVAEPEVEKTGGKTCSGCGKNYHADSKLKRCENCNAKLPKATKASKPTPTAGAVSEGGISPVPAHREPDGPAIEALEHDMRIPTTPDGPYLEMKTAQRIKSTGAPYQLGALHDLLCPGFHPEDASKCHPTTTFPALDLTYWSQKAENAVYGGGFEDARASADMLRHAGVIKAMDLNTYLDLALEAHKSFQDANPGPGTFPNPTELKPGAFHRPVLTAGHSKPGVSYDGPNTHAVPSDSISAAQFNQGYQTAGRAAQSPSNKTTAILPAPVPTGAPQRTFYTNTQRDNARQAMQVLHDHIANTFPDLCPMGAGPGLGGEAPQGARPVPAPAGKAAKPIKTPTQAPAAAQDATESPVEATDGGPTPAAPEAVQKAATLDVEIIKSAVAEVTGGLLAKLADMEAELKAERKRNKKLAKTVDALCDLPDPSVQAFKGVTLSRPQGVFKSTSPAGWTVAESAERTQAALMQALMGDARNDPDPATRERAWAKLYEMNGI